MVLFRKKGHSRSAGSGFQLAEADDSGWGKRVGAGGHLVYRDQSGECIESTALSPSRTASTGHGCHGDEYGEFEITRDHVGDCGTDRHIRRDRRRSYYRGGDQTVQILPCGPGWIGTTEEESGDWKETERRYRHLQRTSRSRQRHLSPGRQEEMRKGLCPLPQQQTHRTPQRLAGRQPQDSFDSLLLTLEPKL